MESDNEVSIDLTTVMAAAIVDAGGEIRVNGETYYGVDDTIIITMDYDEPAEQLVLGVTTQAALDAAV